MPLPYLFYLRLQSIYNVTFCNISQWIGFPRLSESPPIDKSSRSPVGVTKAQFETLLRNFLQEINVKPNHEERTCEKLEAAIYSQIEPVVPNKRLAKGATRIGVLVCLYFYPDHNEKEHYLIGLFAACFLAIDDSGHLMVDDLSQFRHRMMTSKEQPEILEIMVWIFSQFDQHWPTFCANRMFDSIISLWSTFEIEFDQSIRANNANASPLFPKYFRNITGCSEAFTFFLLTKRHFTQARKRLLLHIAPELINATDEFNDLFSFYKESVIDIERETEIEQSNFVCEEARVKGIPLTDVLQSIACRLIERLAVVDKITKEDPTLQHLVHNYLIGQVEFHLAGKRYRLSELDLAYN